MKPRSMGRLLSRAEADAVEARGVAFAMPALAFEQDRPLLPEVEAHLNALLAEQERTMPKVTGVRVVKRS